MIWQGWRDSNSQHADLEFYKTNIKIIVLIKGLSLDTGISAYYCILSKSNFQISTVYT
ncbi:hypothetical protein VCRA2113O324_270035 [Vibrio crassostreae]|nr:hypothetical protein VCRA2113O324_270035 [Vibrio crassostreae]CAK1970061.1 hypothetical protein VCRA2111O320_280028 [Vibrio crassostreae]CAK2122817.1 hypothetical protein VCRA2119O145_490004 [Vibrio crassostreae]CAK2828995.1 hypothetical protein VCRA2121O336_270035 [Vibrio crassostreae]CAK3368949.1 hypothetical protein VCRA217O316_240027 [Vibrio crassostreae]